jgi:hypothetical protein
VDAEEWMEVAFKFMWSIANVSVVQAATATNNLQFQSAYNQNKIEQF